MEAGKLDQRITFQTEEELSPPQDSFGKPLKQWVDAFETWASLELLGSREFPSSQKIFAESTARFKVRYFEVLDPAVNANVSADYRIKCGIQFWNIQPPVVIGRMVDMAIEASVIDPPIEA